ncbi:MAG: AraC family transcriptional regulator [Clostridiales bacterium]|nr:AraC family transcriptional regulator [Clostridiales bacterium]
MKKYFLKGKTFYTLFVMFASLILALVCSAYMICYFALKNASSQLEASLETILTLQVQSIGESYSSDEYSALEAELSENAILTELASRDRVDQDEDMEQAEDLLRNYKESISYADLICYFYFENSGYLMCTMISGADASDLAPDYVTERLASFEDMEIGASEKYLGVDGDDVYYDVSLVRFTSSLGLIRVNLGSPSYELPELFLSNMEGVEMYTYDRYGNVHALEESQELAGLYSYDSLGEEDSDTFTFSNGGHSYIGSYYTYASRPIRLAVFCRDTAAENRALSLRIVLAAVFCLAFVCILLALFYARRAYRPVEELVSRLPEEPDKADSEGKKVFRDDFAIINRVFDQWAEQLQEKDRMLQNCSELVPDSTQLRDLSAAIEAHSKEEVFEQYDILIRQMTELCGNTPGREELVFCLLVDTIALTILDISLPGDVDRESVRGYAQRIRQSQDADELRVALLFVLEAMASETEDGEENERKQFEQIRQYVQDHFRDPNLSAGMVAERFQISPSGLSRKFKKYYQIGFLEYLHRLRVTEAVRLLRETDETITEIAEQCGYTNVYTMNRAFKTYANITPGKIREAERARS